MKRSLSTANHGVSALAMRELVSQNQILTFTWTVLRELKVICLRSSLLEPDQTLKSSQNVVHFSNAQVRETWCKSEEM